MQKEIIYFEKDGIPIRVSQMKMQEGCTYRGIHSHTAIEIVMVNAGVLSCEANGDTVQLLPGQIILINGNISHRIFSTDADITYMQIDVTAYLENAEQAEFARLHDFILRVRSMPYLLLADDREMAAIFQKIYQRFNEVNPHSRRYLKAYLYELVAFLYERNFIIPLSISGEKLAKIAPIVRYVDANYRLPIALEDICDTAQYSKYAVCHNFKAVTGATVFEYINYLRIWQAVEEVKQHKRAIAEIATECGFSSVTYFNRVFKSVMGCSPSVYRKHLLS